MRLLLPQVDRQRPAYGMKEVAIAKHYIDILSIAKESPDAKKLLNYRAPHAVKQVGGAMYMHNNTCTCNNITYMCTCSSHIADWEVL